MPAKTDLTIIILSYNSQFWLKKTLQTLKEFYLDKTPNQVKVVVVDNASSDGSATMVKRQFRWVELLELEDNKGYSAGNNVALAKVKTEYAMLLNSDVEFISESNLDVLLEYLEAEPKVGVITPRVEFTDGELDPASHRGEPDLWASFTFFSGLERLFPRTRWFGQYHQLYQPLTEVHAIDACSGAAMIVRTSAMKKVGLLDERFFMYAEDLDWCKRFREAGYQIVFHPEAKVIHHKYKSGLLSASAHTAFKTRGHFYDTMLQYYDKHYQSRYPQWVRNIIKTILELKKGGT
jgi:N-acetylglucosaminyl-diphospho-decaprenol L-rhamnosyltransferase